MLIEIGNFVRFAIIVASFSIVSATPLFARPPTPVLDKTAMDTAQLIGLEDAMCKASVANDAHYLQLVLADDWVSWDNLGDVVAKKEYVINTGSGVNETKSCINHKMTVHFHGDVAAIHGINKTTMIYHGSRLGAGNIDKDFSGTWYFLDVFRKENGKWLCLYDEISLIKK